MELKIIAYTDDMKKRWDSFVMNESINGTFLQTRRFLGYHSPGKYRDASLLVLKGNSIVGVIPACDEMQNNKRCFYSHKGSTFGGIIVGKPGYNISFFDAAIPALEKYLKDIGYESILYKQTADIFSQYSNDLADYFFYKYGYRKFDEISFYVDIEQAPENLLSVLSASRRRDFRYSLKNELEFIKLKTDEEIKDFYHILCHSLQKFHVQPVHTLDELIEFKNIRLEEIVEFYGVFYKGRMVAGTMVFLFKNDVLHTQYLAQEQEYAKLYLMDFMNYRLMELTREKGVKKFSFGISTEERGKVLNKGLALFKEGFGCRYCVNRSYEKELV